MTRRRYGIGLLLMALVGGVAPWLHWRIARARCTEFAVAHMTTVVHLLALRYRPTVTSTVLAAAPLLLRRPEPGIEAIWIADHDGRIAQHEGAVGPIEEEFSRTIVANARFTVRRLDADRFLLGIRLGDAPPFHGLGARCSVAAALHALRLPSPLPWSCIMCAIVGIGLCWGRSRQTPERRTIVTSIPPPDVGHEELPSLPPILPLLELLPEPILLLDGGQRCVAANAAAIARGWQFAHPRPLHFLDIRARVAWGAEASALLDVIDQTGQMSVHQAGLAVTVLEGREGQQHYCLIFSEEDDDARLG